MEKELPMAIKNSHEPIKNSNDSDVIAVGKLFAELFKKGELTKDTIENKAKEINSDTHDLILTVLGFCDLDEEYLVYKKEKEGLMSKGEIAFSFLEQFRHEPEIIPAEIEKEPEVEVLLESQEPIPPAKITVQPPENLPIEETIETIPNPGRRNWQEVKRETEVMAVEDLDGSMNRFKEHVKKLGVAEEDADGDWHWTGGNKKLVFLGDILGDRNMHGGEISFTIGNLAEQAEKEGGQVDFLCGNHDMAFLHFLCSSGAKVDDEKDVRTLTDQYRGIWELAYFDPDPDSELKKTNPFSADFGSHAKELWNKLFEKMPKILEATRNDPVGRYFLEKLCQIKVAAVYDDTLYCHTDPTSAMVSDLTKDGNILHRVAEVNKIFQENLRIALFDGAKLGDAFKLIEKIYLNTDNREYFTEKDSIVGLVEELLHKRIANGMDRARVEKNIEEWKREYEILGDCTDEVCEIFGIGKLRGKNQKISKTALEDRLIEKIEKINPIINKVEKVRNSGINAIIHGHSPREKNYNNFYNENNFIIASPHAHFDDGPNDDKGISVIRKNGRIELIGKNFRE